MVWSCYRRDGDAGGSRKPLRALSEYLDFQGLEIDLIDPFAR
jgi:hypothetical protein